MKGKSGKTQGVQNERKIKQKETLGLNFKIF